MENRRKTVAPAVEEAWDEDEQWQRPVVRPPVRQPQPEPIYDDYDEDNNWDDGGDYEEEYVERDYPAPVRSLEKKMVLEYEDDVEADAWGDDESPKPYKPTRVNIPEKKKAPEYEEESGY